MATRYFTFVRKEYEQYDNFEKVDADLDYRTSMFLSKDVVSSLHRAYRKTEKIKLNHDSDTYSEVTGSPAFYRSLMSHLALKYWQPKVGSRYFLRSAHVMLHAHYDWNVVPVLKL